jgi:centromere protein S
MTRIKRKENEVEVRAFQISVPENFKKGLLREFPQREIFWSVQPRQNLGKRVFPTRLPPPPASFNYFIHPTICLPKSSTMSQPDEALRERLKASLWFSIGKIVDEETARLNTTATPQFIGAMTEMVWAQIGASFPPLPLSPFPFPSLPSSPSQSQSLSQFSFKSRWRGYGLMGLGKENVAADLESFSRHAGRSTITTDDVLLITRRNDALYGIMREFVDKEKAERERGVKGAAKGKGRVGVKK